MEPNEMVRYLASAIEPRKEIIGIAYCRGKDRGKKIESWINTEMLAKLLELKEKNVVKEVEGEHKYHVPKINVSGRKRYPRCDLWWAQNDSEHWLEVKTLRFHENTDGLKKDYKERIEHDLDRVDNLQPPYIFHHLLIIFDDRYYHNGNWMKDVYSLYNDHDMKKEDKWKFEIDDGKTLHLFLHGHSKLSG